MSNYQKHWDLTTIPDAEWNREHGRRTRAKGPAATYLKLQPCSKCGELLTTVERRKKCKHCGWKNTIGVNYRPNPYKPTTGE